MVRQLQHPLRTGFFQMKRFNKAIQFEKQEYMFWVGEEEEGGWEEGKHDKPVVVGEIARDITASACYFNSK